MIPVFITVRDQLHCPRNLARQCRELRNCEPILLDNGSTYPETVEWLHSGEFPAFFHQNLGNNVAWNGGHVLELGDHLRKYGDGYFVVTDGDVDIDGLPVDLLRDMAALLDETEARKVALSLRIDDLPEWNPDLDKILSVEAKFWKQERNGATGQYFIADSDTHFSMYRAGDGWGGYDGVRIGSPYIARHVPWYWDENNLTPDVEWYIRHMDSAYSTWSNQVRHRKGWAK